MESSKEVKSLQIDVINLTDLSPEYVLPGTPLSVVNDKHSLFFTYDLRGCQTTRHFLLAIVLHAATLRTIVPKLYLARNVIKR